ncbi:hypothetical protein [Luteipulveratus flavus]|uniref:HNH nuclease domain-containing protein n=1 Tax=Luteipulveratus flavus TaxID=3031728 RepID=A0ABT6CB86_9MICO|nr:hypothetical protein [Luteipulveratus sp. YIM 133296]MDF8266016.1 hypothetical protein [Luteipulveratus sp. YIM 133296]
MSHCDLHHSGVAGQVSRDVLLEYAVTDPGVRARYEAKVVRTDGCWYWTGALHRHGHGRFWVARRRHPDGTRQDVVLIAHRFGYAIAHGPPALTAAASLAHQCDEPLCQRPDHLRPSSNGQNLDDWLRRRWHPRSPLRDVRGPYGRAPAICATLLAGGDLRRTLAAGVSPLDEGQLTLWD